MNGRTMRIPPQTNRIDRRTSHSQVLSEVISNYPQGRYKGRDTRVSFRSFSSFVAALAASVAAVALATPAMALKMRVMPSAPQLGDTLSVVVEYDNLEI